MATRGVICVTGIDTDVGKSYATGLMARYLRQQNISVITQKLAQTGCVGISEDVELHRELMGIELLAEDMQGLTCPYVFPHPCSPHLAARLAGTVIDCNKITQSTELLLQRYETIVLEGVGGLLVPLNDEVTLADYLQQQQIPLVLVSSSRLGSINHTLAALEVLQNRGMTLLGIVYNRHNETDHLIGDDSRALFRHALGKYGFNDCIVDLPPLENISTRLSYPDFGPLFS